MSIGRSRCLSWRAQMLASEVHIHFADTPVWLQVLFCLPTAAAMIALFVVLWRERRKQ